jgi:hypothetical protein
MSRRKRTTRQTMVGQAHEQLLITSLASSNFVLENKVIVIVIIRK